MKTLSNLTITRLQVLEVGQHVKSVVKGIDDLGAGFVTDSIFNDYLSHLRDAAARYDKAMVKIMKSDETAKIEQADALRDKAIRAALRYLSVFELSEDESERAAYASLETVFKTYKGLQNWNFEEESNGIDNLLVDLDDAKYLAHINLLNMGNYIVRIKDSNEKFKTLFAGRTQEQSHKEYFDTKALRDDMTTKYNVLVEYVLVMAKAQNTHQFNDSLDVINTVRKYYADMIAKRKGGKKGEVAEPIPPME